MVANQGSLTVALDVTLTDALKKEGIARELINRIQNIRKESGYDVIDKIQLSIEKNPLIESAVSENETYIKSETLTEKLVFEDTLSKGVVVEFDDIKTKLLICKK